MFFDNFDISVGESPILESSDYYPFGLTFNEYTKPGTVEQRYLYQGKEKQPELETYDFHARMYDPALGRTFQQDPLSELYYSKSAYSWVLNNPIKYFDPDGMSTHTDKDGRVISVYEDDDLGVYRHDLSSSDYDGSELSGADGELMGETEFWDEFRAVDSKTGDILDGVQDVTLAFGESWNGILKPLAEKAQGLTMIEIASESGNGGDFDIKAHYGGQGKLLNGKYASARSAGNYLAGFNAAKGGNTEVGLSFETFQKLAGALHQRGLQGQPLTTQEKIDIVLNGTEYGPAPTYGEIPYQHRMSKIGYNDAIEDNRYNANNGRRGRGKKAFKD